MRHTESSLKILACFLKKYPHQLTGMDISKNMKLTASTVYPLLYKMEENELIKGEWEDGEPYLLGHPLRKFYVLTEQGIAKTKELLQPLQISL